MLKNLNKTADGQLHYSCKIYTVLIKSVHQCLKIYSGEIIPTDRRTRWFQYTPLSFVCGGTLHKYITMNRNQTTKLNLNENWTPMNINDFTVTIQNIDEVNMDVSKSCKCSIGVHTSVVRYSYHQTDCPRVFVVMK